eukprot:2716111-Pleurochrysis_carterae.AAC.3
MARDAAGCLRVRPRKAPGGERWDSTRRRAARGGQSKAPSCESGIVCTCGYNHKGLQWRTILYCRQNTITSASKQDVASCLAHDLFARRSPRLQLKCMQAVSQYTAQRQQGSVRSAARGPGLISRVSDRLRWPICTRTKINIMYHRILAARSWRARRSDAAAAA